MQYLKDLPEITYSGVDKDNLNEFEVNGQVEKLPDDRSQEVILFVGRMGGTIYLIFGQVVEYKYIKPEDSLSGNDFTRLKIEGTCVTVF